MERLGLAAFCGVFFYGLYNLWDVAPLVALICTVPIGALAIGLAHEFSREEEEPRA